MNEILKVRVMTAQMIRDRFAVDYWNYVLLKIEDDPEMLTDDVRREVDRCKKIINQWTANVQRKFIDNECHERLLDCGVIFYKYIKEYLGYYEQAVKRTFDADGLPRTDILSLLQVSKEILDLCARFASQEALNIPDLQDFVKVSSLPADYGYRRISKQILQGRMEPRTTMGYLFRECIKLSKVVLDSLKRGERYGTKVKEDAEVARSLDICDQKIQSAMIDYILLEAIYATRGTSLDAALKLKEEFITKVKRIEAKKAHRTQLKNAKKKAKQHG